MNNITCFWVVCWGWEILAVVPVSSLRMTVADTDTDPVKVAATYMLMLM